MEKNELLDTLRDVVARLSDLGVEYMVTGSVAMSVYATARTTFDIDVIVEINPRDEERFERRFVGDYYVDVESIRAARQHQSMFNVMNFETGVKVDVIIRKQTEFETAKFSRRRRLSIADMEFWVISKEDLILSKLAWAKDSHSERQFSDVRNLLDSGVDDAAIEKGVGNEGLNLVWEAFLQWKIQAEK